MEKFQHYKNSILQPIEKKFSLKTLKKSLKDKEISTIHWTKSSKSG